MYICNGFSLQSVDIVMLYGLSRKNDENPHPRGYARGANYRTYQSYGPLSIHCEWHKSEQIIRCINFSTIRLHLLVKIYN